MSLEFRLFPCFRRFEQETILKFWHSLQPRSTPPHKCNFPRSVSAILLRTKTCTTNANVEQTWPEVLQLTACIPTTLQDFRQNPRPLGGCASTSPVQSR